MSNQRILNTDKIETLMSFASISQADVAKHLGVSRTSVSNWLSGTGKPKARNIGGLAIMLGVQAPDLLVDWKPKPTISIRPRQKRATAKMTESAHRMSVDAANSLEKLKPYLPKASSVELVSLKNGFSGNSVELSKLCLHLRKQMGLGVNDVISYTNLACLLEDLNVFVIPVLLGEKVKEHPSEALHSRP